MRSGPLIVASVVIVGLLATIAGIALSRLPAGTQLPVHWNAAGEAGRFVDPGYALYLPVFLSISMSVIFAVLPRIEPLQDRMSGSAAIFDTCWTGLLALMLLMEVVIAASAFGLVQASTAMMTGIGLLLIAIGNALPKSRPGYFIGIRTLWALIDTDNWIATHRRGSRAMMVGGLAIVTTKLISVAGPLRVTVVYLALAIMVISPVRIFLVALAPQRRPGLTILLGDERCCLPW